MNLSLELNLDSIASSILISDTVISNPELLVNPNFDTDLTGWTEFNNTQSWEDGEIKTVAQSPICGSFQTISTTSGKTYEVSVDSVSASVSHRLRVCNGSAPTAALEESAEVSVPTSFVFQFTAISSSTTLYLRHSGSGIGVDTIFWDNASFKEVL